MRSLIHYQLRCVTGIILLLLLNLSSTGQSISLTNIGVPYVQNFNTLSNTAGTTTNNLTINGWYLNETGSGPTFNQQYAVDNGTLATGDVYSYGPTGSTDRALGGLRTATMVPTIGAKFTNNTGYTITSLYVNYKGEEYRQGVTNGGDKLDLSYSTTATDLVTGTYTSVPGLSYVTTFTGGPGATSAPNVTPFAGAVAANITGLSIAPGATFWIRWTDFVSGFAADCGLAVDDFSVTPGAACSLVETFELVLPEATTYTSNGINFTLSTTPAGPNFRCSNDLPTYGFNYSDKYIDNFNTLPNPCTMTMASPIRLKALYVYPSDVANGQDPQTSGVNITFTGKRSGVTKFTYTPAAAVFAGANANDPYSRGFSLVDFSVPGYDNIAIDQLVITLAGTTIYFAIDNFSFCAGACNTITVTNPATTTGTLNTVFSQTFTQSLGSAPVTFSTASTLPTGLSLSAAGVLSGTPNQTGTFPITVTVTDVNGCNQSGSPYSLVIACPTITVAQPPVLTATVGTAYSQNVTSSGGTAPYTYTTSSTLPTGITLSNVGLLSGTTTQSGSFPITVNVSDANTCTGSKSFTLTVNCQTITVTNPAVATGTNGAPFSQTFTQSGGVLPVSFTTASTLPTGLNLATTGVLSGTPTQTGPFNIVATVTDANSCTATSLTYPLVIGAPAPAMSASLRDALLVDNNGNTIANPNDQIRYTNTIRNSGSIDATGVNFQDTVPVNTTLNAGSRVTSALARDDAFSSFFNTLYNAGNVVTNDFGLPSVSVVTFGTTASLGATTAAGSAGTTDQGGTLTVNANGSFAYTPPVGFSGTDKFMYIATTGVAGLPNNDAVVTMTVGPDITFGTTKVDNVCNGASAGSITFTGVSGGSGAGYTYSVNGIAGPFQAGNPYTGLIAATYSPAVKDGAGYIKVGSNVIITEPSAVTFTHVDVNNTCAGASAGSITITAGGGTPGYTYSKNGAGGPFVAGNAFTGLAGTTYSISVKDANGCIVTQSVPLTDPAPVTFTFSKTDITCFGAGDGTISFNLPTGGTGPYTFSINGAGGTFSNTTVYNGLAAATYSLAVKDNTGCNSAPQSAPVTEPLQITVSGSVPNLTYNVAMSNATFSKTNGVGAPANPWSVTAGALPTGVTLNTATGVVSGTPLQTGSFSVTITYTDANSCIGTKAVAFTVAPNLLGDTYANIVGNTQLVGGGQAAPATPSTSDATNILTNDQADVTITVTAGTFTTFNGQGSITIAADGKFTYTPGVGITTADSYTYTGTANGVAATAMINFTFSANMIWYVNNTYAGANGAANGQSHRPYTTVDAAETPSLANQYIYIHTGNGSSPATPGNALLKPGQTLRGAGSALTVGALSLAAGTKPTLTGMITLANSVNVDGFDMNTGATTAITNAGATVTGVTVNIGTVTATTGTGISITGVGPHSVNMTLASLTNSGAAYGINLNNTGGSVTISGGGNIGAATSACINVVGGTVSLTEGGNINQSTAFVPMINVSGGHNTGTIAFNGGTLSATNGTGIIFDNADGIYNFNTTSGSATLNFGGIDIVNGSSGTFNFGVSTHISRANGTNGNQGFRIQNSDAAVTYSGTMSMGTTTAAMIIIDNHDANTITFQTGSLVTNHTGSIGINVSNCNGGTVNFNSSTQTLNTATNIAVSLASNTGATINFTPVAGGNGLDITTSTNTGFNATGGGTINVTGTGNTIVSTTGTALNVVSTTIGASGLNFLSITSNGSVNGIVLTSTGTTGSLVVTGDGGASNNGSGGTIQATSGHAILINNACNVNLGYMNVTNPGLTGIQAGPLGYVYGSSSSTAGANNVTLNRCNISDNAGSVSVDDGITFANATGNISITNCTISTARHQGITFDNFNNNMASMLIKSSSVTGTPGGDGILIQMRGSSVMTTGTIGGATGADGNTISNNSATGLQVSNADNGNILSLNIQNNILDANNAGIDLDIAQSASLTSTVQNNTVTNSHTSAMNTVASTSSSGSSTLTITFRNNNIGIAGVLDSGSGIGTGIRVANGGVNVNLTIDGNVIREVPNGRGIDVEPQAYIPNLNCKVKIVNNQIIRPTGTLQNIGCGFHVPCPSASVFILSDNNNVGGFAHICTSITGNSAYDPTSWPAGGEGAFYFARRTTTSNTLTLEGNTGLTPKQNILANNTVTNFTAADVVDEGSPTMPVVVVAVGSCGAFPAIVAPPDPSSTGMVRPIEIERTQGLLLLKDVIPIKKVGDKWVKNDSVKPITKVK